ncbi:MAG: helix-turn-helix domain-containing protein [Caulobacteraceae bacterium]
MNVRASEVHEPTTKASTGNQGDLRAQGSSTTPADLWPVQLGRVEAGGRPVPIKEAYNYSLGAVERGISQRQLFKSSYIDERTQERISLAQIVLLNITTILDTDDFLLGLGKRPLAPSHLPLMLRIMIGCNTLERALESLVRFHKMEGPIGLELRRDNLGVSLIVSCDDDFGFERAPLIEDYYLSTLNGALTYFLGRRFPATMVTSRNRGLNQGDRHWSLEVPIRLGGFAALHFPTSLLAEERQGNVADDICWVTLEQRLSIDRVLTPGNSRPPISTRLLNTDALCAELGISPATFRRRNTASGQNFRRFREETLVEASLGLLADETRSVTSIAAHLGYADVRSFRRFIKGATGLTPDQLRSEAVVSNLRTQQPEVLARIMDIATRLSV